MIVKIEIYEAFWSHDTVFYSLISRKTVWEHSQHESKNMIQFNSSLNDKSLCTATILIFLQFSEPG